MILTERQSMYRAAKKIGRWYNLWADGKERHVQQEWQHILFVLQKAIPVVQAKAQAALTGSAVTDIAITGSLAE